MKKKLNAIKTGIIQNSGMVLSDDGQLYEPDMIHNDTILLVCSSWNRYKIKNVVNRKVQFIFNYKTNRAYNFKLI